MRCVSSEYKPQRVLIKKSGECKKVFKECPFFLPISLPQKENKKDTVLNELSVFFYYYLKGKKSRIEFF